MDYSIFVEAIQVVHGLQIVLYTALALLIGFLFERVVLHWGERIAAKTKWEADDVVASSLGHIVIVWCTLLGLYIGITRLPLNDQSITYVQKAGTVLWIILGTVLVMRIASGLLNLYSNHTATHKSSIYSNLARVAIFLLGALVVLQTIGVSVTPLLTAIGVGSLAIALGLQETLSNLFSGLSITAAKKIKIGDFIKLDTGEEGYVQDIDWRHTTIKAVSSKTVIVPNSVLSKAIVTNYTLLREEKSVVIPIGISYSTDLQHAEDELVRIATEIIKSTEGADNTFNPLVRFNEFGDFSIKGSVILRAKNYDSHFLLRHEFIKRAHAELASVGIEIPFPTQVVQLKKQ